MRTDKETAFKLRRAGKTYLEICALLGMSRSTLCEWFKVEDWSNKIKKLNTDRHIKISTEHLRKLNEGRRLLLESKYKKTTEEAEKEFEVYKNDPLFMAGLMLYAGEGDKLTKSQIRFANTDFFLHKIFLKFIYRFTKTNSERIKVGLLLYPDLNIDTCKSTWSQELKIPESNFYKPQVIQGREKVRRLHFGVGSIIISDSFLKKKIQRWIEMSKSSLAS